MWLSGLLFLICSLSFSQGSGSNKRLSEHPLARSLPESKLSDLAQKTDYLSFYDDIFLKVLRVRSPGTVGHHEVKLFIKKQFEDLKWTVTLDEFDELTPFGPKRFTNIIATLNPNAKRRLILAAHYDSKYFKDPPKQYFLGATDSAMPCAMLIEIAKTVTPLFKVKEQRQADTSVVDDDDEQSDVTLQMVFFDGEEAFVQWSETDSLYGSRHLAELWSNTSHPSGSNDTMLSSINAMVLLDLIGASNPVFYHTFKETSDLFDRLQLIERRLISRGLIERRSQPYFPNGYHGFAVEDDHIPFLRRNVKILHLISLPFPPCWHEACDNGTNVDNKTVQELLKIFQVFVVEYFGLAVV